MRHNSIKKYEKRLTRGGAKLVLWRPLERGGASVVASVEIAGSPSMSDFMDSSRVRAVLPERLLDPAIQGHLSSIATNPGSSDGN